MKGRGAVVCEEIVDEASGETRYKILVSYCSLTRGGSKTVRTCWHCIVLSAIRSVSVWYLHPLQLRHSDLGIGSWEPHVPAETATSSTFNLQTLDSQSYLRSEVSSLRGPFKPRDRGTGMRWNVILDPKSHVRHMVSFAALLDSVTSRAIPTGCDRRGTRPRGGEPSGEWAYCWRDLYGLQRGLHADFSRGQDCRHRRVSRSSGAEDHTEGVGRTYLAHGLSGWI